MKKKCYFQGVKSRRKSTSLSNNPKPTAVLTIHKSFHSHASRGFLLLYFLLFCFLWFFRSNLFYSFWKIRIQKNKKEKSTKFFFSFFSSFVLLSPGLIVTYSKCNVLFKSGQNEQAFSIWVFIWLFWHTLSKLFYVLWIFIFLLRFIRLASLVSSLTCMNIE